MADVGLGVERAAMRSVGLRVGIASTLSMGFLVGVSLLLIFGLGLNGGRGDPKGRTEDTQDGHMTTRRAHAQA
jgi:hypothetical protein